MKILCEIVRYICSAASTPPRILRLPEPGGCARAETDLAPGRGLAVAAPHHDPLPKQLVPAEVRILNNNVEVVLRRHVPTWRCRATSCTPCPRWRGPSCSAASRSSAARTHSSRPTTWRPGVIIKTGLDAVSTVVLPNDAAKLGAKCTI